ncbi:MAG: hypothetical protein Q7T78_00470 [Rhodoferax sp.]|nr:hypothetical protein [Rhodoferax sp.]
MKNSPYPTIRAEITNLQSAIKLLDLPGKIKHESLAIAEQNKFNAENSNIQPMSFAERQSLLVEADRQEARARRTVAEREANTLTQAIGHLTRMLNADDRAARAQKEIDSLTALVNAAQAATDTALKTHKEIENLVFAESLSLDKAKSDAAGAVLAQIKSGKQGKLPPVSRERLEALILAQDTAAAELLEAQEALAECASNLADAQHELADAMADGTARTLHIILRDYAHALRNHKAASYRCGRQFDEPDVDMLVRQLEREAVAEAEGE